MNAVTDRIGPCNSAHEGESPAQLRESTWNRRSRTTREIRHKIIGVAVSFGTTSGKPDFTPFRHSQLPVNFGTECSQNGR